jgi:hypothetical protein
MRKQTAWFFRPDASALSLFSFLFQGIVSNKISGFQNPSDFNPATRHEEQSAFAFLKETSIL